MVITLGGFISISIPRNIMNTYTFRLCLLHGRHHPNEKLNCWGFKGPCLNGISWIHGTYLSTLTVGFGSHEAMLLAKRQTGWEEMDTCVLQVTLCDDMIEAGNCFYGDFEIQHEVAYHDCSEGTS